MTIRHALLLALLFVSACAAPGRVAMNAPVETEPGSLRSTTGPEIWAYHAYWMGDAWRSYDLAAFGRLLFMDLAVCKDCRIAETRGWPDQWASLNAAARAAGVQLDPGFTILTPEIFTAVFTSAGTRRLLLEEIVELARFSRGVHLDFEVYEGTPTDAIAGFRTFLADLRRTLDQPPRKVLTAFVPAGSILYGETDLAMLDAVIAQGYDVHWQKSPNAGPPALLEGESLATWRSAAILLENRGVARRKILFSTPFYGYEWPTLSAEPRAPTRGPAEIITYAPVPKAVLPDIRTSALARIREHGLRREMSSGSPWYAFRDAEGWRQGWFDDAVSLTPRLDFVRERGYRGVAVFVLGYDNGELLGTIRAAFSARTPPAGGASPPGAR